MSCHQSPRETPRGHSVYQDPTSISLHQLGDLDLVLVLFLARSSVSFPVNKARRRIKRNCPWRGRRLTTPRPGLACFPGTAVKGLVEALMPPGLPLPALGVVVLGSPGYSPDLGAGSWTQPWPT